MTVGKLDLPVGKEMLQEMRLTEDGKRVVGHRGKKGTLRDQRRGRPCPRQALVANQ